MTATRDYLRKLSRKLMGGKKESFPDPLPAHDALVEKARLELQAALSLFNNVIAENLIDCAIFKMNAAERRYIFLLQEARRKGNAVAVYEQKKEGSPGGGR
jgi:hypothetical protein